ncbi:pectin lyase fold/virulence factor [Plectosphaerella plurivora]|uniref:Pectin lyase fold/virulence factor n=1 Tax=Plectosphaerella plurivora TaxID=936078 RepID=A0A9P9AAW1_9PEZI|nr:pectin lyase fold/virulence factor [Plectosphaerella plurivora]
MKANSSVILLVGLACSAAAASLAPRQSCSPAWGQCGGSGWTGASCCVSGSSCVAQNQWYSQCIEGASSPPPSSPPPASPPPASPPPSSSCATVAADGFASQNGGTTGGNGGTVVTVTNQADLERYAGAAGRYVIRVQGRITISPLGYEVRIANDKTIIGVGSTGEIRAGGFRIQGTRNIIIRNLRIGNSPTTGDNDFDGIQADGASNVWIDHCLFENAGDGLVDLRADTTFWTVSNNIFRNHDKTFGIGWTTNVVARGTLHSNFFDGTNQRNPSADNLAQCHMYNNYVYGITSYGHYARGATNALVENVFFENTRNPLTKDAAAALNASGNVYKSCTGTVAANSGTSFRPPYAYTLRNANDVPAYVRANAGPQASICS